MAASGSLGIDIEQHRRRNFAALAAHAFSAAEQAEIAAYGADAFYRIWTLREAIAKATGEGLAAAANGREMPITHSSGVWHFMHRRIEPDYSLTVAHAHPREEPWAVEWCDLAATSPGPVA